MDNEAKPLAIHCYAAFSDGVIRGVWIDMDRKIVHIENTPLSQVPRDMMQILDKDREGITSIDERPTPQASENLKKAQEASADEEVIQETRRNRNSMRKAV
jgi:hypothetical protein